MKCAIIEGFNIHTEIFPTWCQLLDQFDIDLYLPSNYGSSFRSFLPWMSEFLTYQVFDIATLTNTVLDGYDMVIFNTMSDSDFVQNTLNHHTLEGQKNYNYLSGTQDDDVNAQYQVLSNIYEFQRVSDGPTVFVYHLFSQLQELIDSVETYVPLNGNVYHLVLKPPSQTPNLTNFGQVLPIYQVPETIPVIYLARLGICGVINSEQRNYQLALDNVDNNITFKIIGTQSQPSYNDFVDDIAASGYQNQFEIHLDYEVEDYLDEVKNCKFIMPLVQDGSFYYTDRLTGSIPLALSFEKPLLLDEDLRAIYGFQEGYISYQNLADVKNQVVNISSSEYDDLVVEIKNERDRLITVNQGVVDTMLTYFGLSN